MLCFLRFLTFSLFWLSLTKTLFILLNFQKTPSRHFIGLLCFSVFHFIGCTPIFILSILVLALGLAYLFLVLKIEKLRLLI